MELSVSLRSELRLCLTVTHAVGIMPQGVKSCAGSHEAATQQTHRHRSLHTSQKKQDMEVIGDRVLEALITAGASRKHTSQRWSHNPLSVVSHEYKQKVTYRHLEPNPDNIWLVVVQIGAKGLDLRHLKLWIHRDLNKLESPQGHISVWLINRHEYNAHHPTSGALATAATNDSNDRRHAYT